MRGIVAVLGLGDSGSGSGKCHRQMFASTAWTIFLRMANIRGLNPCAHSIWAFSGVRLYPELAAALVIHICEHSEFLTFDVVDVGARTVVRCLANIRVPCPCGD
jgi:hypothetical protein